MLLFGELILSGYEIAGKIGSIVMNMVLGEVW